MTGSPLTDKNSRNDANHFVLGAGLSDISKKYKLQQTIGHGTFGVVRKCQHRTTGKVYAVKTILKTKVPDLDLLKKEVDLLTKIDHPHIIKLYDAFEEPTKIHLVTELCTGGELYDRVVEKSLKGEHFSEYDAARILRNILDAIDYCHSLNICHRDLKVENFLLLNKRDDSPVKIIDFGLSRFSPDNVMTSRVGTVYYVAPEVVLAKDYTNKCDVWSIGIIAYVILCGFPPFHADNEFQTLQLVKNAPVEFPSPTWDDISEEAKQFILRLLNRDPEQRPTAREALQDPWLQNEQVQPEGVSRRACFLPSPSQSAPPQHRPQYSWKNWGSHQSAHATTPPASKPIQMKNGRREGFSRFLLGIKLRKRVDNSMLGEN